MRKTPFAAVSILTVALLATFAHAEDASADKAAEVAAPPPVATTLPAEFAARELELRRLEAQARNATSVRKNILQRRLVRERTALLAQELSFVERCLDSDVADDPCIGESLAALKMHPAMIANVHTLLMNSIKLPDGNPGIAEQVAAYSRIVAQLKELDRIAELALRSISLSTQLRVDMKAFEQKLGQELSNHAADTAMLLEMAADDLQSSKAALKLLPEDADLKARVASAENRIRSLGEALSDQLVLLKKLGMETGSYDDMVIAATGQIRTQTLQGNMLGKLLASWSERMSAAIIDNAPTFLLNLLLVLLILVVFRKLSRIVATIIESALERSAQHLSILLRRMTVSLVSNAVMLLGILIALSQLGISLGPVLAGVGVAGFIVGFAMQDTLSNFASGMMILVYQPFDVGDVVEVGGVSGKVSHMSLVSTTILTFDNQTLVVPNNKIWGSVIKNMTYEHERRVDMKFGIAYSASIESAEAILNDIIAGDPRVLKDPEPRVRLHELSESSVNFIVRPWVKTDDYWDVYWDITRAVKLRFDAAGIQIPFPQRDVHLDSNKPLSIRIENARA